MRLIFLTLSLFVSGTIVADTRDNAIALFDWAESSFPELLSPAAPELQEIQGFFVRHYTDTNIYLGVQGDNLWAFGEQLGPDIIYVGKIGELISIAERDITDEIFSSRRGSCSYYAEPLFASVLDLKRSILFSSSVEITVDGDSCVISSNNIPNHDFNDSSAGFADNVAEVATELRIPLAPSFANNSTAISLTTDNAVFLNGVKLDLLAAACFNVGDEKIGCNDINQPWRFDPMSPLNNFGTDMHNAHTQPGGAYHYHGNPIALFDQTGATASGVIGFAADGFPIFGSYIDD
ncbi:MAG: YHYH protein, partial [Gammaproteobacteria bacterium]